MVASRRWHSGGIDHPCRTCHPIRQSQSRQRRKKPKRQKKKKEKAIDKRHGRKPSTPSTFVVSVPVRDKPPVASVIVSEKTGLVDVSLYVSPITLEKR